MKPLSTYSQGNKFRTCLSFSIFLLLSALCVGAVRGASVPIYSSTCADILFVFTRGSSSNPDSLFLDDPYGTNFSAKEEVPGAFFRSMKTQLENNYPHTTYKAVPVHNFENLYSINGYKAVGIFGF